MTMDKGEKDGNDGGDVWMTRKIRNI
jgi:hypothetical protein